MNVLFEFFILQEINNNKEIIDKENDNENLFFGNEKLVKFLYIITYLKFSIILLNIFIFIST